MFSLAELRLRIINGDKLSVIFCRQGKPVCSGAKTIPGGRSLPEIVPEYLNNLRSASAARASNDGESQLRGPFRRRSSRFRCSSVVNPHHAGETYCREATVVALATRCNS